MRSSLSWSASTAFEVVMIRTTSARRGYGQTQLRSNSPLIRPKCARRGYDQTRLRSNSPLIRPKCARRGYDQTRLRSKSPLIRLKCSRIRLWSGFSDQNDLWSDHLQTIIQTLVRSNFRPDPVISVWEHTGVHSTGSDHKSIWVWTSTWETLFLSCSFNWFSSFQTFSLQWSCTFWVTIVAFCRTLSQSCTWYIIAAKIVRGWARAMVDWNSELTFWANNTHTVEPSRSRGIVTYNYLLFKVNNF